MVWDFIVSGGELMAPILLCSVIALGLLMERAYFWIALRLRRDDALRARLLRLEVGAEEASSSLDPFCRVLGVLMRRPDDPAQAISLADRIVSETRASLPVIQVIAAVSTSLGLLGTVVGVAMAFQTSSGSPHMSELASALSVALNTTVLGLLVYLPAYMGGSFAQMASTALAAELEHGLSALESALKDRAKAEALSLEAAPGAPALA